MVASRVSLHDCAIELKMPALSSLPRSPGGRAPSLETVAGLTADGAARDLHAAYMGETIALVVVVRVPGGAGASRDAIFFALERLGETRVFLGAAPGPARPPPPRNALRRTPPPPRVQQGPAVPVLRESEWVQAAAAAAAGTPAAAAAARGPGARDALVFAKTLCVLLRTPPEASRAGHLAAARGRLRVTVVARERAPPAPPLRARAAAAIARAARVAGRPLALVAAKDLTVRVPLDVRCAHVTAGGSAAKAFVSVAAVNTSTDAVLSVVPPFVHVTASRVVRETARGRIRVAHVAETPIPPFDVNTGTYLDDAFEFVPCFDDAMEEPPPEDAPFGAHAAASPGERSPGVGPQSSPLAAARAPSSAYDEDLGLFIPAFSLARRRAVQLAPQEEFNFVYEICPRGSAAVNEAPQPGSVVPMSIGDSLGTFSGAAEGKKESTEAARSLPRLAPGTAFETSVAVAWSCASRDALDAAGIPGPTSAAPFERTFSSGGVLALGERRSVAVRVVAVQWRPPALVDDVVVSFAGPRSATVRGHVPVTVTVRNQSPRDLNAASLYVQRGAGQADNGQGLLLTPLRTAIALGRVPAGGSARVELLCVALKPGALSLGEVKVVDLEADGVQGAVGAPVWCAQSSFEVFVVDSAEELSKGIQSLTVGSFE